MIRSLGISNKRKRFAKSSKTKEKSGLAATKWQYIHDIYGYFRDTIYLAFSSNLFKLEEWYCFCQSPKLWHFRNVETDVKKGCRRRRQKRKLLVFCLLKRSKNLKAPFVRASSSSFLKVLTKVCWEPQQHNFSFSSNYKKNGGFFSLFKKLNGIWFCRQTFSGIIHYMRTCTLCVFSQK